MKIFVDIYLAYNLGDDLFLDILAKKYPSYEFTVNFVGSDYDSFISQYKNVNRRKYTMLNKIGQRLKISNSLTNYNKIAEGHDALLFIGGSIFREEGYHDSLYADRMKLVYEFKKRGKSVFVIGANFGPFTTEKFLNDYKEFFKLCDDVCFRDLYSYGLFRELSQVRYAPDIVFQMDVNKYKYKEIPSNKKVGFSIIDVRHKNGLAKFYNEYLNSTVKSIEMLTQKGYECGLMSFCEKEGDLEIINMILTKLSLEATKKVSVYNYKGNLEEAIQLIASFKLFIAARFHANIIALMLGIGVMPIIYSNKTSNMLKDINVDSILVNMEELHLQYDENVVNKSFDNKVDLTAIKGQSREHFKKLGLFL